eukprot:SAG11_NODE_613_length_8205_cov_28.925487_11_plen_65_part_00
MFYLLLGGKETLAPSYGSVTDRLRLVCGIARIPRLPRINYPVKNRAQAHVFARAARRPCVLSSQ